MSGRLRLAWLDTLPLEQMRQRVVDPARALGDPVRRALRGRRGHPAGRGPGAGEPERRRPNPDVRRIREPARPRRRRRPAALDRRRGPAQRCGGPAHPRWRERVERLAVPPAQPERYTYDWRELHRWKIPERRLPPGSDVRFRPPSLWEAYRRPLLAGLAVLGLQALLIAGLLAQRAQPPPGRGAGPGAQPPAPHGAGGRAQGPRARAPRRLQPAPGPALDRRRAARVRGGRPARRRATRPDARGAGAALRGRPRPGLPAPSLDARRPRAGRGAPDRVRSLFAARVGPDPARPRRDAARAPARCRALPLPRRAGRTAQREAARPGERRGPDLSRRRRRHADDPARRRRRASTPTQTRRPSLGLAGMRERAALVGGSVEIRSAPGRGTTIAVWVPGGSGAS